MKLYKFIKMTNGAPFEPAADSDVLREAARIMASSPPGPASTAMVLLNTEADRLERKTAPRHADQPETCTCQYFPDGHYQVFYDCPVHSPDTAPDWAGVYRPDREGTT